MTAQISDTFCFNGHEYTIVGIRGGDLFRPDSLGLHPVSTSSGCWRGYFCQYRLEGKRLVLDRLQISLGRDTASGEYAISQNFQAQEGPAINGIKPSKTKKPTDQVPKEFWGGVVGFGIVDHDYAFFNNAYEGLGLVIDFTGGILIGDGYILELHVNMGFRHAWKYQRVIELVFDSGVLVQQQDVSDKIEKVRKVLSRTTLEPGLTADKNELREWIASTFSLDYEMQYSVTECSPNDRNKRATQASGFWSYVDDRGEHFIPVTLEQSFATKQGTEHELRIAHFVKIEDGKPLKKTLCAKVLSKSFPMNVSFPGSSSACSKCAKIAFQRGFKPTWPDQDEVLPNYPKVDPNVIPENPEQAHRYSSGTKPMPDQRAQLPFKQIYTEPEYQRIKLGLVPREMEDKWFIFWEDHRVYFHRSWTHICIYQMRLESTPSGYAVVEAWVNRDPNQYKETNNSHDLMLLEFLVNSVLLGKNVPFPYPEDLADENKLLYYHHLIGTSRTSNQAV